MFSMNTFASVFGIAVVEAWQAAPAGGPWGVVQASQALPRGAVTAPCSAEIHMPVTLAALARFPTVWIAIETLSTVLANRTCLGQKGTIYLLQLKRSFLAWFQDADISWAWTKLISVELPTCRPCWAALTLDSLSPRYQWAWAATRAGAGQAGSGPLRVVVEASWARLTWGNIIRRVAFSCWKTQP